MVARDQGLDFRLAHIHLSFPAVSKEPFDTQYTNALYRLGEQRAREGDPWLRVD